MLLYHFPLTSNSATPNLENKGLKSDYTIGGQGQFVEGGKISSFCWNNQRQKIEIPTDKNGQYTLCFRYKNGITQNTWSILFSFFGDNNDNTFVIGFNGTKMYFAVNAKIIVYMPYSYKDNKWHDVLVTYNNRNGKAYIDNSELCSYTAICNKIAIGGRANSPSGGSQNFNCQFQDIRIYDYCLSQQEIKDYSKALVLHYPLNGSELGNVVKDCSGLGNDGEIKESVATYVEGSPRGEFSYSIKPSYIRSKVIPLQEFSISFWMKQREQITAGGSVAHHIISCVESGGCCLRLYRSGDIQLGIYGDGSSITLNMSEKIVVGIWYHVCAIYTQNSIKLYLNGSASSEKTTIPIIYNSDTPWAIGVNPNASGYDSANPMPPVNISDVRVYATALSESDIKDIYDAPINFDKKTMTGIEFCENEQTTNDNKFHKTGVVKANEISEGTQCFNENGITYEKIKEI